MPEEPLNFRDVREIELSAIYSTSRQRKLEWIGRHVPEESAERAALESVGEALRKRRSAPWVTVVRGEDIKEAVRATDRFITLKEPPARPVGPDDKSASQKFWLFVYLGHDSSSPPQWLVYPPTVFGTKVRFSYTRFDGWFSHEPGEGPDATADDYGYYCWVPLGKFDEADEIKAELVELTKTVKASYPPKARKK